MMTPRHKTKKPTAAKKAPRPHTKRLASGAVDLRNWELDALDRIPKRDHPRVLKLATEVLSLATEQETTFVSFPGLSGDVNRRGGFGQDWTDPLDVYLHLGLDDGDGNGPVIAFDLGRECRERIDQLVNDCEADGSDALSTEAVTRLVAMKRALEALVEATTVGILSLRALIPAQRARAMRDAKGWAELRAYDGLTPAPVDTVPAVRVAKAARG